MTSDTQNQTTMIKALASTVLALAWRVLSRIRRMRCGLWMPRLSYRRILRFKDYRIMSAVGPVRDGVPTPESHLGFIVQLSVMRVF